jgi:hypothetical protein
VEDHVGTIAGAVKSSAPLDFILQVVNTTTTKPPTFTIVPGSQTVFAGIPGEVVLTATDPQGGLANIQLLNPVSGMTTVFHSTGGELHVDFTPTAGEIGTSAVESFQAIDNLGLTAQTSVKYTILNPAPAITNVVTTTLEGQASEVVGTVAAAQSGDTLTITQTGGTNGTVSLGAVSGGVQQVIYTTNGAANISLADAVSYTVTDTTLAGQITDPTISAATTVHTTVQIDGGPNIVQASPAVVENGQATVIGTVSPGLAGDTLTLTQTAGSLGSLSLGAVQASDGTQQVIYTAPASIASSTTDAVSYTVKDQHNVAVASGSGNVQLDAGPTIAAATLTVIAQGHTEVIGTVTPGIAGDTLTLTQAAGAGTLSLGVVSDGVQ